MTHILKFASQNRHSSILERPLTQLTSLHVAL